MSDVLLSERSCSDVLELETPLLANAASSPNEVDPTSLATLTDVCEPFLGIDFSCDVTLASPWKVVLL